MNIYGMACREISILVKVTDIEANVIFDDDYGAIFSHLLACTIDEAAAIRISYTKYAIFEALLEEVDNDPRHDALTSRICRMNGPKLVIVYLRVVYIINKFLLV